jgi:hypothetical protein
MSYLISAPYRRGQDNITTVLVGCITMQLASMETLVHLCVGLFTLLTSLFVLRSK